MLVVILILCAVPAAGAVYALRRWQDVHGRSVKICRRGLVL